MLKLKDDEGNAAIWLDHEQISNEQYKESGRKLSPSLFDFAKKLDKSEQAAATENKNKKRKADEVQDEEVKEVEKLSLRFIEMLKESFNPSAKPPLERFWEETDTYPNFKGGNNSESSHEFKLNAKTYLIPPKCRFYNLNIAENLDMFDQFEQKFDFVVLDPPWRNKYIKRLRKAKDSLGYKTMDNEAFAEFPIDKVIHENSLVAIWCTNSKQHQNELLNTFLPRWKLKLVSKLFWVKVNTSGEPICNFKGVNKKQPFELLYVACSEHSDKDYSDLTEFKLLISIPSIVHSHKPPILNVFKRFLPENPNALELFARYLQPGFTSVGLQVLKLMDTRLFVD